MLADIEILLNEKTYLYIVINKVAKTRNQMNQGSANSLMKILGISSTNVRRFPTMNALDDYVKTQFQG